MRWRRPLYLQILVWLFLNLAVLGLAFYFFARIQFRFGLDSFLLGQAGERIQAASDFVTTQLAETTPAEWAGVLARFSEAYGVVCQLYEPEGRLRSGEATPLPPEVVSRMMERRAGGGLQGRGGGPAHARAPGRNLRVGGAFRGPQARFVVRSENPTRYWIGVRIPAPDPSSPAVPPWTLMFVSSTLSGGGLFVDLQPWMVAGFAAVLFSMLLWFPFVRRITRSIADMNQATERIAQGDFGTRVVAPYCDELESLGGSINRMGVRLEGFVQGQKRFLGDIAHELCSPVARIEMAVGILEQRADEKQRPYVLDLKEDVRHTSALLNDLLSFSRTGLQTPSPVLAPLRLADAVETALDREKARPDQVAVHVPAELTVLAERELLTRAIANLVRNALRYAGDCGPVELRAQADGEGVLFTVSDLGPGVPEEALNQIFDPFYRIESSRSRRTGGVGLGLAIVKAAVETCGGTVSALNRQPTGLSVVIRLQAPSPRNAGNGPQR